jgi:hypothetical protein
MSNNLVIKANLETEALTQAKKFAGSSHGLSMMALNMLDALHKGLNVTMSFEDGGALENCADQMLAVWMRCESNKVLLRSVKQNSTFLKSYFGKELSENTAFPSTSTEYNNAKIILDAELSDFAHTYKFYRWNELTPRVLILNVATNAALEELLALSNDS